MKLSQLADIHQGETIWVFGSGASVQFLDPAFFDDKVCVATNLITDYFPLKSYYLFTHYHPHAHTRHNDEGVIATVTHDVCSTRWSGTREGLGEWCFGDPPPDNIVINELTWREPMGSSFDPARHNTDGALVFGTSSIHGSMHLAAHMGAKHIMLVGADCGTIDNMHRVEGYPSGHTPWQLYNNHLMAMKKWLGQKYGVTVYSLNPFVNFNLEGHTFHGVDDAS